jgi:predicted acyltransferase
LFLHVVRRAFALMLLGWWGASWSWILWPGDTLAAAGYLLRPGYVALVLGAVVLLAGTQRRRLWWTVFGAGLLLFFVSSAMLGMHDPLLERIAHIRIPGVLVRIGVCYLIASGIYFLTPSRRALIVWIGALLGAYLVFMLWIPIPGFGMPDLGRGFPTLETPGNELFSNWAFYIDYHVFGTHTWSVRQLTDETGRLIWSFDPEGLISTIPATCSVLFGVLAGKWMHRDEKSSVEKLNGLFVAACWLMLLGLLVSIWMPINKRLWTSSYTVFTAGMALLTLAVLYHAVDLKGARKWVYPFVAYGRNAIFAFVLSGMMAVTLGQLTIGQGHIVVKTYLYGLLPGSAEFASFLFGMLFVTFWGVVAWVLDRSHIYLKL